MLGLLLPSLFYLPQAHWALAGGCLHWCRCLGVGCLAGLEQNVASLCCGIVALGCAGVSLLAPDALLVPVLPVYATPWVIAVYSIAAVFWCLIIPFWLRTRWALGRVALVC
jgi:phosphatidate cytidylyltransferase